ncbi:MULTISPECIES: hypothetical protein [Burkholderia]|nr:MULTISPECIES: hypothetical protein [Burkholderia]ETP61765.1 hypothetical protein BDSB_28895 [Burkholderia dolosa PC543]
MLDGQSAAKSLFDAVDRTEGACAAGDGAADDGRKPRRFVLAYLV